MSWTKRQLINQAFSEIGLASYDFDMQPEEYEDAMRQMDSMLADWEAKGIDLGYPVPTTPSGGDLDEDTTINLYANRAVYTNLALLIAPSHGKLVSSETKASAKSGYNTLLLKATLPTAMQFPANLPKGAGTKYWRDSQDPFFPTPEETVT